MSTSTTSVSSSAAAPYPDCPPASAAAFKDQDHSCAGCKKPDAPDLCDRCLWINYCSRECQKADWARHKLLCAPATAYEANARAAQAHHAAASCIEVKAYRRAISYARAGILANPTAPNLKSRLHVMMAHWHYSQDDYSMAAEAAQKGLDAHPSDPDVIAALYLTMARLRLNENDPKGAEEAAKKVLMQSLKMQRLMNVSSRSAPANLPVPRECRQQMPKPSCATTRPPSSTTRAVFRK